MRDAVNAEQGKAAREMNRVDELERALDQVDTARRRAQSLLDAMTGPPTTLANLPRGETPKPVRTIVDALNDIPKLIEDQCAQLNESLAQIRAHLKL